MSTLQPNYDASSIQTHKGLAAIRNTPHLYIDDLEDKGITRTILEIVTNSVDEMLACKRPVSVNIIMFYDEEKKRTQFLVQDNGRGIPILPKKDGESAFYSCVTVPHTSGKFNQVTYAVSGGQFGVGSKVTGATAKQFTAVSFRPEGVGFIHVKEGIPPSAPTILKEPEDVTGLVSFWEPDNSILTTAHEYGKEGYFHLLSMLGQLVFFRKKDIKFYLCDKLIPEKLWTTNDPKFLRDQIQNLIKKSKLIWDGSSGNEEEKTQWIKAYWNLSRNFTWSKELVFNEERDRSFCEKIDPDISNRIVDIVLKFYYLKGDRNGGYFSLVNMVPLVELKRSDQTKVVIEVLTKCIAQRIPDENVKKFFLTQYTLPLFLAVSVDYKGPRFSGATKTAWVDAAFRNVYRELLTYWFESEEIGKPIVDEYYELIAQDIETRYQDSLGVKTSVKNTSNLRTLLGKDSWKFCDAQPKDGNRMNCELFLLEGNSTGGGEGYDTEHQATWFMQGKPRNILKGTNGNMSEALKRMLENKELKNVFLLLNFDPRKKDISNLYFGRVCITPDADAHGGHIASLLLTAFQTLAPELVNIPGFFQIVIPPYYQVCFGKNASHTIYMRNKDDLPIWCAENIFMNRLKIKARYSEDLKLKDKEFEKEEYITLTDILFEYGLTMDNISSRLQIHPEILEAFCHCTYYLSPSTMDTEVLRKYLRADKVVYHPDTNTLTLTYAEEDIPIPLLSIKEELYGGVLCLLNKLGWKNWHPCITTLRSKHYHDTVVGFYQLYSLMKFWRDKLITITPLKGLGSMNSRDLTRTCMDVRNRKSLVVEGIGDVNRIIRLMERDTAERKKIASLYMTQTH